MTCCMHACAPNVEHEQERRCACAGVPQIRHSLPCSQGRGGPGLVASSSGDALFVIGGFAGRELNDVHRFDLGTSAWDCPGCCSAHEEAAAAQRLPPRSVFGVGAHASCVACSHGGHLVRKISAVSQMHMHAWSSQTSVMQSMHVGLSLDH